MLDLLPCAVLKRSESETVRTDHRIGMYDHIVTYLHARVNTDSRIDDAVRSDLHAVADENMFINLRVVTHTGVFTHICKIAYVYLLSDLRAPAYPASASAVSLVRALLRGHIIKQARHSGIRVIHTHHSRRNRLLRLE